ncbi:hypothetical protein [uncultured Sphingomonas sp.]|uniref:hypothetical protein n=1 Tax=uncultured Sphingomonas sp. TaxID=158754 RepID=UPI0025F2E232|nr:hypothetical protein [uncultured Sphingomonas sp.]
MSYVEDKKLHQTVTFVGLRAQATAVGLVQLCRELECAGVLGEAAMDRIKGAISREIAITAPPSARREEYEREVRLRLDRLFTGEERVGDARAIPVSPDPVNS